MPAILCSVSQHGVLAGEVRKARAVGGVGELRAAGLDALMQPARMVKASSPEMDRTGASSSVSTAMPSVTSCAMSSTRRTTFAPPVHSTVPKGNQLAVKPLSPEAVNAWSHRKSTTPPMPLTRNSPGRPRSAHRSAQAPRARTVRSARTAIFPEKQAKSTPQAEGPRLRSIAEIVSCELPQPTLFANLPVARSMMWTLHPLFFLWSRSRQTNATSGESWTMELIESGS